MSSLSKKVYKIFILVGQKYVPRSGNPFSRGEGIAPSAQENGSFDSAALRSG
jgi:hypothetical protein